MEMIVIKKAIHDPKHGYMLEPFFGKNIVILYKTDISLKEEGLYKIKMSKDLISVGKDSRNIPMYIRLCTILGVESKHVV